jgi:D-tyrosyl-tRNA(Tyr) deacylase
VRVVVQRVERAAVWRTDAVAADPVGIDRGLLLLAGFRAADDARVVEWMADKCLGLRIFGDAAGAMNHAVADIGGAVLVVPNFTLYGDARKGRRPSFTDAAPPAVASRLFEAFVAALRCGPVPVASGFFQAAMHVELVNDGPVTLVLERDAAAL